VKEKIIKHGGTSRVVEGKLAAEGFPIDIQCRYQEAVGSKDLFK